MVTLAGYSSSLPLMEAVQKPIIPLMVPESGFEVGGLPRGSVPCFSSQLVGSEMLPTPPYGANRIGILPGAASTRFRPLTATHYTDSHTKLLNQSCSI